MLFHVLERTSFLAKCIFKVTKIHNTMKNTFSILICRYFYQFNAMAYRNRKITIFYAYSIWSNPNPKLVFYLWNSGGWWSAKAVVAQSVIAENP